MGLDQSAYSIAGKYEPAEKGVDFNTNNIPEGQRVQIHYWRKHANLQGWMQQLYRKKGGQAVHFNCVPVALTREDLSQLERDIIAKALPETTGFFFGKSFGDEDKEDLEFIQKARTEIALGNTVYYSSWW